MVNNLGYKKNLFILPFDHRSSFAKLFGFKGPLFSSEEKETITTTKQIIYAAFKRAVEQEISKEQTAILIDEEYGDKIIRDAKNCNYNVILTTEKSGQREFAFEYGDDFAKHIEKYNPAFVKALIRYAPNANWTKLKILSEYCHLHKYKFLLEILTENKTANEALGAIKEFQSTGIEPDIWKLEGMDNQSDYEEIVRQATSPALPSGGRDRSDVGVVILGRGENKEKVEQWINAGKNVKGIIGFAVGRTLFWEPLTEYKNGKMEKEKTIEIISNNFLHFYHIFLNKN